MVHNTKLESLAFRLKDLESIRRLFAELNYEFADEPVYKEDWNQELKDIVIESRIIAKKNDFLVCYVKMKNNSIKDWKSIAAKIISTNNGFCIVCSHNPDKFTWIFSSLSKEFSKSFAETRHIPIEIKPNMGMPTSFLEFLDSIQVEGSDKGITILRKISEAFDKFSLKIHDELTVNVFEALKVLSEGIIKEKSNGFTFSNEVLETIREPIFILLYRIIFVLYAEDRSIFPLENKTYLEKFSLKWIKHNWILNSKNQQQLREYQVQNRVKDLFKLIEIGSEELGFRHDEFFMRAYYGRLFDRKLNPQLEKWLIPNRSFIRAIELLTSTTDKNSNKFFLDYTALKIRHLGSIYEHLLEFHLTIQENVITDLPNSKERKTSGSYYTPNHVVDYIIKNSIEPVIEKIIQETPDTTEQIEKILSLKILDPAMGSGHFLVGATEYLAKRICEIENKEDCEREYIERKRDVVRRCIYGVDVNPLAVDLAKLSLWLETISSEKPLSFLSAHLKQGNSLVGTSIEKVFDPQQTLFESQSRSYFKKTVKEFLGFEALEDDTASAVKAKLEKYSKMQSKGSFYYRLRGILDNVTASLFGIEVEPLGDLRQKIGVESIDFYSSKSGASVYEYRKKHSFFYWELEFPEIFFNENGEKKSDPGFDVIVGNPPYVRVESLESDLADYYKDSFETVYDRCDLYIPFMQQFFELLNNQGRCGMIVQNQFMISDYGLKIREMISTKWGIDKIIDFTNYSPFEKISSYSCIIIGLKKQIPVITGYRITSDDGIKYLKKNGFSEKINHPDIEFLTFDSKNLSEKEWVIRNKIELNIFEKLKTMSGKELVKVADIASPLVTGKDSSLCSELVKENNINLHLRFSDGEKIMMEKVWKPLLRPENSKKWVPNEPHSVVFFPYTEENNEFVLISEKDFKKKYLQSYTHLHKSKEILLERKDSRKTWREKGLAWYSLHRLGEPKNHAKGKIITKSIINQPCFAFDSIGFLIPHGSVYGITPYDLDPFFLLGYLNSKIVYYFVKSIAAPKRGGYVELSIGALSEIRIPDMKKDIQNRISQIAKTIYELLLKEKKIKKGMTSFSKDLEEEIINYEKKLDDEIFSFFNLSEEEIQVIEKVTSN